MFAHHEDHMNDPVSKPSAKRPLKDPSEGLTCSEGQVEDLLSLGESTEAESEEEREPAPKPTPSASVTSIPLAKRPKNKQKLV
jgi:hypothetical protein